MTANADLAHTSDKPSMSCSNQPNFINNNNSNAEEQKPPTSTTNNITKTEDVFEIAAKAQKLLQEILLGKKTTNESSKFNTSHVKQEPTEPIVNSSPPTVAVQQPPPQLQQQNASFVLPPFIPQPNYHQQISVPLQLNTNNYPQYQLHPQLVQPLNYGINSQLASFAMPQQTHAPHQSLYYQQQQQSGLLFHQSFNQLSYPNPVVNYNYHQPQPSLNQSQRILFYGGTMPPSFQNSYYRKRKFGEINNNISNSNSNINNTIANRYRPPLPPNQSINSSNQSKANTSVSFPLNESNDDDDEEEEDLNLMREKELNDLKSKSVIEKMNVLLRYYRQFKEAYSNRVHSIDCNDSLRLQFRSLIKCLNEYENLLVELNGLISEHERIACKNNHRKTKKFFNKSKAFIRYECHKRLQSYIFEYRRLIQSQDRYAGMYDLIEMNNYLISLLPDIGISIRRCINRCEKAREEEKLEDEDDEDCDEDEWNVNEEENSNDSEQKHKNLSFYDPNDLSIPTFKEFVALTDQNEAITNDDEEQEDNEDLNEQQLDDSKQATSSSAASTSTIITNKKSSKRIYESFSIGIDSLNRYLLKRVEDEGSLDELVKERIVKWINKRQAKYITIFSEVDKLLNQHKLGLECYSKFHSYLLFNLGKLVTVCDSYHQKLKELLYSTTIKRKKKRKKVKLLPESMTDVFNEINDLKRALELAKINIKKCKITSEPSAPVDDEDH